MYTTLVHLFMPYPCSASLREKTSTFWGNWSVARSLVRNPVRKPAKKQMFLYKARWMIRPDHKQVYSTQVHSHQAWAKAGTATASTTASRRNGSRDLGHMVGNASHTFVFLSVARLFIWGPLGKLGAFAETSLLEAEVSPFPDLSQHCIFPLSAFLVLIL